MLIPFFQIFKKAYLKNLTKPSTIFCLSPFLNIKKRIFTNLKNTWNNFFAYTLFQILKKVYLQILKKPSTIVLLIPFFQIFKYLRQFFKYLKKHTYKSQNTFFILIIILKETIYIKTIIQVIPIKTIISTILG